MPIKVNCLRFCNPRFDFGVPLEDIFPPNDIHPRLKHLFEEAYRLYTSNGLNIEQFIRQLQGPLETRLKLKQKIIYDAHYDIRTEKIEKAPGAYFWAIRHFLGLLPIPLLPTYSQEIHFDWVRLSGKCKKFLQYYESERERKHQLDYEFAENLNLLPFEHFLLLTVLIHFIRKISKTSHNGRQINRRALLFLSKYYCGSTSVRPYIPGQKDEKMFPLFFYMVLRWRKIERNCKIIGHPAYFLESNCLNYESYTGFSIRDNWSQTPQISPEIIRIYRNVPYFCDNNNYLKDISCQTEQTDTVDKGIQNSIYVSEKQKHSIKVIQEKVSDQESSSLYPSLSDTISAQVNEDMGFIQGEKLVDNTTELSFLSTEDNKTKEEWEGIVNETMETVKKVEEYIYDDYDTFNKEDYNQISESSKSRGSLMHKVSRIGWTYTPENSAREEGKEKNRDQNANDDSYIKFEDVFDENGKYKVNGDCDDDNKFEVKDNSLNITFKKNNDSKTPLFKCVNSACKEDENEGRSKKNFNLKRFKLKLDFLRVLTPKRATPTPSYDSIDSKVKYKKIKNIKSSTL